MTKRLKKKRNRSIVTVENVVGDKDNSTPTFIYIKKKYLNKGSKDKNCSYTANGDYISTEYTTKHGFKYVVAINNCYNLTITVLKSWNNKNHVIFKSQCISQVYDIKDGVKGGQHKCDH